MKRKVWPLYLGMGILLVDFITKYLTQSYLPALHYDSIWYPYGGIGVFRDFFGIEFSINHATNKGAAWGILAEYQEYLLVLRILCILGITLYLAFFNKNKRLNLPFSLIIAGAIGNVCDYFIYGHVIDMFHFVFWGYSYPVFNVADSAIFIGIIWLFFASALQHQQAKSL